MIIGGGIGRDSTTSKYGGLRRIPRGSYDFGPVKYSLISSCFGRNCNPKPALGLGGVGLYPSPTLSLFDSSSSISLINSSTAGGAIRCRVGPMSRRALDNLFLSPVARCGFSRSVDL